MNYSRHLLFALSLERKIMLEKDNFHHLVFEWVLKVSEVAY